MSDFSWLRLGAIIDEGRKTALYPYPKLGNIPNLAGAGEAVLEETERLEKEFGRSLIEPFYRLIWTLNTCAGVCTSHIAVSRPNHKSSFAWARHYLGAQVTTLSRNSSDRLYRRIADRMVTELRSTLLASPS
ncbi:MAG: hypothetical protein A3G20_10070 [Acidobacteria bacterium RIFCSPLOWO2_12_FULL_59_11]|nr:MAG: hypothetical protein A3G20_10070 [Acidobacteria bacterium RIFCSPLOWO2_12_FULL_59_11]